MRRIFVNILLLLLPMLAVAQLDNMSRLRLRLPDCHSRSEGESAGETEEEKYPFYALIMQVADDEAVKSLEEIGVVVYHRRGDLLLTAVPRDSIDAALDIAGVLNIQAEGLINSALDRARPFGRVDEVQAGRDLPMGYDGRGVVVGFSDTGFDPHHIAFKDRVISVYDFDIRRNRIMSATTPEAIARWEMPVGDDAAGDETAHATHVANILAGGYRGNGYYGVAPGADIVASTVCLTDVGILCGVEEVIARAKAEGRPAVVNLSLSNHLGPHDGTSLCSRYLAECAKDAVICISAGNSGKTDISAWTTLTRDNPVARVSLNSLITWNGFNVSGYTDLWCLGSAKVKFRYEVYDIDTQSIVYASDWIGGNGSPAATLSLDSDAESGRGMAPYISGSVAASAGISSLNGRYNVAVAYDTDTQEYSSAGRWARYYNAIAVALDGDEADASAQVLFFADGNKSYFNWAGSGSAYYGSRGSINDMATAEGVIAVGACNSRNTAPLLSGGESSWNFRVGDAAAFSSYSNLPGIDRYPHFCAPGNFVVSAVSDYFAETEGYDKMAAEAVVDGRAYYWSSMCGTSMSAPYAAGVAACWLQADPSLTSSEIRDIAMKTARTDFVDFSDPRWGAGCVDAMAGLRYIIEREALVGESLSAGEPLIEVTGRCVRVTMPSGSAAAPRLFTPGGVQAEFGTPLTPGIYIVTIPGYDPRKIRVS